MSLIASLRRRYQQNVDSAAVHAMQSTSYPAWRTTVRLRGVAVIAVLVIAGVWVAVFIPDAMVNPLAIVLVAFSGMPMVVLRQLTRDVMRTPQEFLDERQLGMRLRATARAYTWLMWVLLTAAGSLIFWVIVSADLTAMSLTLNWFALAMALIVTVGSLPQIALALTEPGEDTPDDN